MEWDNTEVPWPIPAALATSAPTAAPAKRRYHESHGDGAPVIVNGYGMPPQKRVRGDKLNGILRAARSAPRTCHDTVTRIPNPVINNKPKESRRGAERLTIPESQGIYHRSQFGPILQQGRWLKLRTDSLSGSRGV